MLFRSLALTSAVPLKPKARSASSPTRGAPIAASAPSKLLVAGGGGWQGAEGEADQGGSQERVRGDEGGLLSACSAWLNSRGQCAITTCSCAQSGRTIPATHPQARCVPLARPHLSKAKMRLRMWAGTISAKILRDMAPAKKAGTAQKP